MKFKCTDINERHSKFNLYDKAGANCGHIAILTTELTEFAALWRGTIDWNGFDPLKHL